MILSDSGTHVLGLIMADSTTTGLTALISAAMERVFGARVNAQVVGSVSWADLGTAWCVVLLLALANWALVWLLRSRTCRAESRWGREFLQTAGRPAFVLMWTCGGYVAIAPLWLKLPTTPEAHFLRQIADGLFGLGVFGVVIWFLLRMTRVLEGWLAARAQRTESKLDDLVVPLAARSLRLVLPVVGIMFALPLVGLPAEYAGVLAKGSSILIIGTVAWILSQAVHLGEKAVLAEYDVTAADNLQARKVYTQVHVLSKTLYVIIAIFTAASILMLFEEVRRFGTSLLASAGVIGIIVGFAAQRTIANLFAGFQLAMTQPIRLDDVVVVEGEWGRVEEITLTYVVIHVWDERRLIVPLSYFIEKPFQNWTRASANLLGSVFLWVDYSLPLRETREAVREIVEANPLWDKRFWNLAVTDANERAMQIRVLATAADSGKAWDLRCEIREKLVEFIQDRYRESLPRLRAELGRPQAGRRGG